MNRKMKPKMDQWPKKIQRSESIHKGEKAEITA